jgi:hypothetical protein
VSHVFRCKPFLSPHPLIKQNPRSLATKTPRASINNMNLTKSVRALATDINAAPQYESNDDVSDENEKIVSVKCVHNNDVH